MAENAPEAPAPRADTLTTTPARASSSVKAARPAKPRAPAADAPKVQLHRRQDGFITDPIDRAEADKIRAGYPGEYLIYSPPVGGKKGS